MVLAAVVRSAIAVVAAATQTLQEELTHEAWTGDQDGLGTAKPYGDPVPRQALVQRKEGLLKTPGGQERSFRAVVSFLGPVAIDARDRITLSDGLTGPILDPQGGLVDPDTGQPFLRRIYLG